VPGDYDGDGITDPTVYRPQYGTWFVLTSSSNYAQYLAMDGVRRMISQCPPTTMVTEDGRAVYQASTGPGRSDRRAGSTVERCVWRHG